MNQRPKRRRSWLRWTLGILVLALVADVARRPAEAGDVGRQLTATVHCEHVIAALKHCGDGEAKWQRPVPQTANALFREVFENGNAVAEAFFGCPQSVFTADNEVGTAPDFAEALQPGECHWMVLKARSKHTHPKTPVVIENALTASWPPRWEMPSLWASWFGLKGPRQRGHAWRMGTIVIGRQDGSAAPEKLRADGMLDWHSKRNLDEHGKSWIDYLTPEQIAKLEYWDAEEKRP